MPGLKNVGKFVANQTRNPFVLLTISDPHTLIELKMMLLF